MKKPIWSRCSFYGETRRLICTSRNWELSQTEFLTKDADLFLKCFFFRHFFHVFTIGNELTSLSINRLANMEGFFERHCVKSVQIRIYFWSVFSCIWTEYGEIWSLRIQSEYRKIRTRNNSVFGHFSRSEGVHLTLPPHIFAVKFGVSGGDFRIKQKKANPNPSPSITFYCFL